MAISSRRVGSGTEASEAWRTIGAKRAVDVEQDRRIGGSARSGLEQLRYFKLCAHRGKYGAAADPATRGARSPPDRNRGAGRLRYPASHGLDNPLHILILLVVGLLVFGAKRLPEIGRSLGEGMRGFKDSISGDTNQSLSQAPKPHRSPPPTVVVAAPAAPAPGRAPCATGPGSTHARG